MDAYPGSGGPWEWRTLGVADPGIGGPWKWRTLGVADPGSGGGPPSELKKFKLKAGDPGVLPGIFLNFNIAVCKF